MVQSQVSLLVRQCLHQRKPPEEFDDLLTLVIKKWKVKSTEIVVHLINSAFEFCGSSDPLVSSYVQVVLNSQRAQVSEFLTILILHWQNAARQPSSNALESSQLLATMLADLCITASSMTLTEPEIRKCITLDARWLKALFGIAASSDFKHSASQSNMLVSASAMFLITMMNLPAGLLLLKSNDSNRDDPLNSAIRQAIDASMETFPDISMQLLGEAQKHPALIDASIPESDNVQVAEMAAIQFANNLHNAPDISSRLATYVYLYQKLLNSATIDETVLYNFLDTRHSVSALL